MANTDIVAYIKERLQNGEKTEAIKIALREVGWGEKEIIEAFGEATIGTEVSKNNFRINPAIIKSVKQKEFKPKKKRVAAFAVSKKIAMPILFVIAAIGLSVLFYFKIYQNPDRIMAKMWRALGTVKTGEYAINASVESDRRNGNTLPFLNLKEKNTAEVAVSGKFDFNDAARPELSLAASIATDVFSSDSPGVYQIDGGASGGIFYFKFDEAPVLPIVNLNLLKGRWIELSRNPLLFGPIPVNVTDARQKIEVASSFPKEDSAYHYAFRLDEAAAKTILKTVELGNQDFVAALGTTKGAEGEIWIDKKTFLPKRLLVKTTFDGEENGINWNIELSASLSKVNDAQNITKPENIQTVEEIAIESIIQKQGVPKNKKN